MLPIHRILSVIITFQCNAECDQCGTFSSPRERGMIDEVVLRQLIDEAKKLKFEAIVFTGGEATLRWNALKRLIKYASNQGLLTRLVTNAVWATSRTKGLEKLNELCAAGLNEINFSTGDEHKRFVPLSSVANAINAAMVEGIPHRTMIETRSSSKFSCEELLSEFPLDQRETIQGALIESPWMPMSPFHEYGYDEKTPTANSANLHAHMGCDSVLGTYVAYPDGKLSACCGLGARMIEEMHVGTFSPHDSTALHDAIVEAEQDMIKLAVHFYGPFRVLQWAAECDPSIQWENKFAHKCQGCAKMYKDEAARKGVVDGVLANIDDIEFATMLSIASAASSLKAETTEMDKIAIDTGE